MFIFHYHYIYILFLGNALFLRKGAPSTPLIHVAVSKIVEEVLVANSMPPAICTLVSGGAEIGEAIARDRNIPLVSFTGSTPVSAALRTCVVV